MGETHVFKTGFSRFFPIAFAGVVLVASVLIVISDPREITRSVPLLVGIAIIVWVVFGYPRVEVSDGGITLVNVLRTVHIPWPCFSGADSRWNLRIDTTAGAHTSWALPAGSGTARRLTRRGDRTTMTERQLAGNTAEAAAVVIAERLQALREAGHLDPSTLGRVEVTTSLNRVTLIGAALTVALVAAGLL